MSTKGQKQTLKAMEDAARHAGALMRKNLRLTKRVNFAEQYDIKLELDVRCQKLIEKRLRALLDEVLPEAPKLKRRTSP